MAAWTNDRGSTSIKYTVLRENFYQLVISCEHLLPQLVAKCFEKQLLNRNELNITGQNEFKKSASFVQKILDRVETDSKWYDEFLKIIFEFSELKDIANNIVKMQSTYLPLQASKGTSKSFESLPPQQLDLSNELLNPGRISFGLGLYLSQRELQNKKELPSLSPQEESQLQTIICELRKDLVDKDVKLKELEEELDKKNKVIADLQKKYDEVKELVQKLMKENENVNANLSAKLAELERTKTNNEQEFESIHQSYMKQIKELRLQIYVADLKLTKAGYELERANVEKEGLKQMIIALKQEKEREALIKEKEMALKDKEIALKGMELAQEQVKVALKDKELEQKDKELAQMKAAELQRRLDEMCCNLSSL